jgi:hypothetical protein
MGQKAYRSILGKAYGVARSILEKAQSFDEYRSSVWQKKKLLDNSHQGNAKTITNCNVGKTGVSS